jgi:hypothetical protein
MMKLEDYDIILSDSSEEEEEETDDFTMEASIGGESFYDYSPSAKKKISLRFDSMQTTSGNGKNSKNKSKRTK